MHSTSKTVCSARTSDTVRGNVITGLRSGGRLSFSQPPRPSGHNTESPDPVNRRPEPAQHAKRPHHGSWGWGGAPLVVTSDNSAIAARHVHRFAYRAGELAAATGAVVVRTPAAGTWTGSVGAST